MLQTSQKHFVEGFKTQQELSGIVSSRKTLKLTLIFNQVIDTVFLELHTIPVILLESVQTKILINVLKEFIFKQTQFYFLCKNNFIIQHENIRKFTIKILLI